MTMNLPNKLTILRVCLIPFFIAFLMIYPENFRMRIVALVIFLAASFTDTLDGMIARKYNLITNFGKFMDPIADKLLVCSAFICFVELGELSSILVIIIIAREFIISGFRLIASDRGIVIAASSLGKLKTVSQMSLVVLLIINLPEIKFVTLILTIIMTALTVLSLIEYLFKNAGVLTERSSS